MNPKILIEQPPNNVPTYSSKLSTEKCEKIFVASYDRWSAELNREPAKKKPKKRPPAGRIFRDYSYKGWFIHTVVLREPKDWRKHAQPMA